MDEGTPSPWAHVNQRRAEGASDDTIAAELRAKGLEQADIDLLLRSSGSVSAPVLTSGPSGSGETPWAVVRRMRAEGFGRSAIEEELARRDVAPDDIAALFADDTGERTGEMVDRASSADVASIIFGALLILVAVLIFFAGRFGTLQIVLVLAGVQRIVNGARSRQLSTTLQHWSAAGLQALPPDDPRPRCSAHPTFASLGSCDRCGSFCCAGCIAKSGLSAETPCLACLRRPEVFQQRLTQLARRVSARMLVGPAAMIAIVLLEIPWDSESGVIALVVASIVGSLPWLVLATMHWFLPGRWAGWAVAVLWTIMTIGWLLLAIAVGTFPLDFFLWLVALWPAVTAFRGRALLDETPRPLISVAEGR